MQHFINQIAILLLMACFVFPVSAQEQAVAGEKPNTTTEELSYALGMDIGNAIKRFGAEIDFDILVEAAQSTLKGDETLLTPQQARKIMREFALEKRKKQAAERKAAGEKNLAEGEAFLAENKTKEGIVTTDSGLQYLVIKEGSGAKPKATDRVKVHYRGTLLDGTEFDSSYKRRTPATFLVKAVIAGWTEALQLMPVGSKFKLFIPSELAYGERGAGNKIGPNSTLIFEVELLDIIGTEPKQPAVAPQAEPDQKKETEKASKQK